MAFAAHGDEAASLLDGVESGAVGNEILDDRKRFGTVGLDDDDVAIGEATHVGLAGGDALVGTVGLAVDDERAGAADALATVVRESDGVLALGLERVVHDVEHLKEGHVGVEVPGCVFDEAAGLVGGRLAPDAQRDGEVLGGSGVGDHRRKVG
jgi:hypothetical protein